MERTHEGYVCVERSKTEGITTTPQQLSARSGMHTKGAPLCMAHTTLPCMLASGNVLGRRHACGHDIHARTPTATAVFDCQAAAASALCRVMSPAASVSCRIMFQLLPPGFGHVTVTSGRTRLAWPVSRPGSPHMNLHSYA
eukprot:308094-Chlamydomonas_euryale.AAC.4